jgi:tetratricopeptide (TPR) repeat protein
MRYGSFDVDPAQRRALLASVEGVVSAFRTLEPDGWRAAVLEAALLTAEAVNAHVAGRSGAPSLRKALALLAPQLGSAQPSSEALEGALEAECYAARSPELGDPVLWLDRALAHGKQALALNPGRSSLVNEMARVSVWRMSEGAMRGQPPWEVFETAVQVVTRGLEREPDAASLWEALGYLWGERAEYERTHELDPRPSLEQSVKGFEAALRQGPSFRSQYGLANAALMQGQWETVHHLAGAAAALERADQAYLRARLLAPLHSALASNLVETSLWKARAAGFQSPRGQRALEEGAARFEEGGKRYPKVAVLWLRGAQLAEAQGRPGEAKARIQRALELDPHNPDIRLAARRIR